MCFMSGALQMTDISDIRIKFSNIEIEHSVHRSAMSGFFFIITKSILICKIHF